MLREPSVADRSHRPPRARGTLRARLELGSAGATPALTAALLVGVLGLQLFMIGSYVGALHEPKAREVPVAVAGPPQAAGKVAAALGRDGALDARVVPDAAAARRQIEEREVYGALVLSQTGGRLLVAGAASAAVAEVLPAALRRASPPGRALTVSDVKPLPSDDPRGLSPFYLVVGWLVGGYLGATILGLARGGAARDRRAALARIGALAGYAVASGLLGVLVVQDVIGVLEGDALALAAVGALLVFATSAATAGLQALLGVAGTALVLLLFVALGNPASGGPLATELLMPEPWRAVGGLLPPGAGTTLVRDVAYFDDATFTQPLLVLVGYALIGSILLFASAHRRSDAGEAEALAGPPSPREDSVVA